LVCTLSGAIFSGVGLSRHREAWPQALPFPIFLRFVTLVNLRAFVVGFYHLSVFLGPARFDSPTPSGTVRTDSEFWDNSDFRADPVLGFEHSNGLSQEPCWNISNPFLFPFFLSPSPFSSFFSHFLLFFFFFFFFFFSCVFHFFSLVSFSSRFSVSVFFA